MSAPQKTGLALITACLLVFLTGTAIRSYLLSATGADRDPFFMVESAQHFRYIRMVANAEPIPTRDRDLEWPDGALTGNDTLLQKYLIGWSIRGIIAALRPARETIPALQQLLTRYHVIFFAALPPVILLLLLRRSGMHIGPATLLAAIMAVNLGLVERSYGSVIYHEHTAMPFIMLHWFWFCRALSGPPENTRRNSILAGLALAAGLYAWKAARFYYLLHLGVIMIFLLLRRKHTKSATQVVQYLAVTLIAVSLIGAAAQHLRSDNLVLSPAFLWHLGMVLGLAVRPRLLARRRATAALIIIAALGAVVAAQLAAWVQPANPYGHVWSVVEAQLAHGFSKPADPALLNFEARLYWVPPYVHASVLRFANDLGLMVMAGLGALGLALARFRRHQLSDQYLIAAAGAVLTGAAYALFFKTITFFLPLLIFLIGCALLRWQRRKTVLLMLGAVLLFEGYKTVYRAEACSVSWLAALGATADPVTPAGTVADRNEVIRWLAANTAPGEAVVAHFGMASPILTYAHRPIVLHSYFEAPGIRAKIFTFATALFAGETDFAAWMQRYHAQLFVYSADMALARDPRSYRYLAAAMQDDPRQAAYRFHFHPETLAHFTLVHQNDFFRVFRLGVHPGQAIPAGPVPQLFREDVYQLYAGLPGGPGDRFLRDGYDYSKGLALAPHLAPGAARRFRHQLQQRYGLFSNQQAPGT